ncbi:MAG: hypothetical protein WC869_01065 [Phycisphaerae bacterium]|jgi:hypothetical protein
MKGFNHVIQLPIPRSIGQCPDVVDLFEAKTWMAWAYQLVGKPVTCEGKVVGKVVSRFQDQLEISIDEEHFEFVNNKMKEKTNGLRGLSVSCRGVVPDQKGDQL